MKTLIGQAPTIRAGLAEARRQLNRARYPNDVLVSGGDDGLYRCTFLDTGDVLELTIVLRERTRIDCTIVS